MVIELWLKLLINFDVEEVWLSIKGNNDYEKSELLVANWWLSIISWSWWVKLKEIWKFIGSIKFESKCNSTIGNGIGTDDGICARDGIGTSDGKSVGDGFGNGFGVGIEVCTSASLTELVKPFFVIVFCADASAPFNVLWVEWDDFFLKVETSSWESSIKLKSDTVKFNKGLLSNEVLNP